MRAGSYGSATLSGSAAGAGDEDSATTTGRLVLSVVSTSLSTSVKPGGSAVSWSISTLASIAGPVTCGAAGWAVRAAAPLAEAGASDWPPHAASARATAADSERALNFMEILGWLYGNGGRNRCFTRRRSPGQRNRRGRQDPRMGAWSSGCDGREDRRSGEQRWRPGGPKRQA